MTDRVVVVGASLAGVRTAQALRSAGHRGQLVLLGSETHEPYDRPPLSKGFLSGSSPTPLLGDGGGKNLAIDLRLGRRAVALDTNARVVETAGGATFPYDQVVLATGASARTGPWSVGGRVHALRTLDDAVRLRDALAASSSIVIVGGGVVGLEVASGARARGLQTTVVEGADRVLARLVTPEVSDWLAQRYREEGVDLRLGAGVEELGSTAGGCTTTLSNGSSLESDVVVVAIGAEPHTQWLEGSGVPLDDGIWCDASGRVEGIADAFAVGDVARWFSPRTGRYERGEHWTGATEQASCVAHNLVHPEEPRELSALPYMWSDQFGFKLQVVGRSSEARTCHLDTTENPHRLSAVFVDQAGCATGAAFVGWPRGLAKVRRTLEEPISGVELAGLLGPIG